MTTMNVIEGAIRKTKGLTKSGMSMLTRDKLTKIEGDIEKLLGEIQSKYDLNRDDAIDRLDEFANKLNKDEQVFIKNSVVSMFALIALVLTFASMAFRVSSKN